MTTRSRSKPLALNYTRRGGFDALQTWAYAVGAPYHVANGWPQDELGAADAQDRQASAESLREHWSIQTADELVRQMDSMGATGHRYKHRLGILRYSLMLRPAVAARREELREQGQTSEQARDELWRLNAVQADHAGVRGSTMLAFDALRGIMLARHGWNLGWLAEEVFWDYVLDIARDVQRSYRSWQALGEDFMVSRNYWRASDEPEGFGRIIRFLLSDPASPWRRLPWTMPGLEVPRPPRTLRPQAPAWRLE